MFGISGEHVLILLVVLLFFGPRRLPELGNSLGKTLKNFRDAMNGNDAETRAAKEALPPRNEKPPVAAEATAETANVKA